MAHEDVPFRLDGSTAVLGDRLFDMGVTSGGSYPSPFLPLGPVPSAAMAPPLAFITATQRFQQLIARVSALEQEQARLTARVAALEARVSSLPSVGWRRWRLQLIAWLKRRLFSSR